jgi:hypothetical protein
VEGTGVRIDVSGQLVAGEKQTKVDSNIGQDYLFLNRKKNSPNLSLKHTFSGTPPPPIPESRFLVLFLFNY